MELAVATVPAGPGEERDRSARERTKAPFFASFRPLRAVALVTLALAFLANPEGPVLASEALDEGPSGLPLPRFVSLKSDEVNVRGGPGTDYRIRWIFRKAGLPVEIVQEFGNWRRIRDSEGDDGWVLGSLLSGERTALVRPWGDATPVDLHAQPEARSRVVARLEPKVLARVRSCDGSWCLVAGEGWDGFVPQDALWGVYPGEVFD